MRRVLAFAILITVGLVGTAMADDPACTKDADCAGDMVCVGGKCVTPPTEKAEPPKTEPVKTEPVKADPPPVEPPAPAGCASDSECKGDRICDNGKCVAPAAKPAEPPAEKPAEATKVTKRYHGSLSGAGTVSFRVRIVDETATGGKIRATAISGATARVGGRQFGLRGRLKGGGKFVLAGKAGKDWVKVYGTVKPGSKWVKGDFQGTVNKRHYKGTYSAAAR